MIGVGVDVEQPHAVPGLDRAGERAIVSRSVPSETFGTARKVRGGITRG